MKELKEIKKMLRLFERDDVNRIKEAERAWNLIISTLIKLCEENNTKFIPEIKKEKTKNIIEELDNWNVSLNLTNIRGWKWESILTHLNFQRTYSSFGSYNRRKKLIIIEFDFWKKPVAHFVFPAKFKDTFIHEFTHAYDIIGKSNKKSKEKKGKIIKKYVAKIVNNIPVANSDDFEKYKNNPLEYNAFLMGFLDQIFLFLIRRKDEIIDLNFREFYNFIKTSPLFAQSYKQATDGLNEKYKKKFLLRLYSFWNEIKENI